MTIVVQPRLRFFSGQNYCQNVKKGILRSKPKMVISKESLEFKPSEACYYFFFDSSTTVST